MMSVTSIARNKVLPLLRKSTKIQSTASLSSLVKLEEKQGYAVVSMQKPPVNSLSLEMIQALSQSLIELEKNKCKGIILTSACPGIFSAGLDIREMYQPTDDRLNQFWSSLQTLWLQLYGSKMATVALINGHAPAGGCLLAMCCDSRIMLNGKSRIGLNETKLGIVAPSWFKDTFVNTIGVRQSERALQLGSLFSPEEALKIGLVDKLVPDMETATAVAEAELKEFLQIPGMARYLSKMRIREAAIKDLSETREADLNQFVNFAKTDAVQKGLGLYLQNLAKKN
ncbi:enoyl-CoA delta isomerase 1, mitochondrial-like [Daphnia pulicaria]|uniref:enoyl-CoA delta isomerase 1, mitochondrial-like n=1 Tax=Daphnia pulicaria TaxID=35523 RepID=UPI001EE9DB9D|nr:enoyl-CoA delta isomerase 1, mitochondrial-like [Daphnia pulicaria]XP_046654978.1 enoyl-CoA delta isomerase 1, mitochondrial-like [Daphnia pulicaria]